MLVSILNFIFNAILFIITVASWLVLIYVVMALVVPQNKYTLMIGRFVEPVLSPLRKLLFRIFPRLRQIGVDFSPLLFYLLIQLVSWLIRLLQRILI
ncbi:MAG: YggT family protein [Clostridiales bacterium]|nr:YggT family protein [Clostridiales bacterium]